MRRGRASSALFALLAAACVTRADHDAALARMRSLEHQRAQRSEEYQALLRRNAALHAVGSRLAVERSSLDSEKRDLQGALAEEQRQRAAREAEIGHVTGSYRDLVDELEREVEAGKIEIHELRGRLQVRALEQLLFDSGSAALKPEGAQVLRKVAQQLARLDDHSIRVEGHTDDVPIHTARFASNWELSVARAAGVVRALEGAGIPSARLSAQGFGPYQPIGSNADPAGRARNRRIEIVLVPGAEE